MCRLVPLLENPFDVLVIGAGIYGATLACSAAQAGFRVALIDRNDYGSGASANSLKILHGGLRYLQHLDIRRMRDSIHARSDGLRQLPHLSKAASFLVPSGSGLTSNKVAYYAAARLNDAISRDRNRGLPPSHILPKTSVWSKATLKKECPALGQMARGALSWWDGFIENTERYTLAYVESARHQGAVVRNYVRCVKLLRKGNAVIGAHVRDEESGMTGDVRSVVTINAAGVGDPNLWPGPPPDLPWTRAYNLVLDRRWFGAYGVGLKGRSARGGSRFFFFAPWRESTIVGTVYVPYDPGRDTCALRPGEIESFIDDINRIYPAAEATAEDVRLTHVGILPARENRVHGGDTEPAKTFRFWDYETSHNIPGYWAVQGVKYTTAALWADRITTRLLHRFRRASRQVVPGPLYGAGDPVTPGDVQKRAARLSWPLSSSTARWLAAQYGTRYTDVLGVAGKVPELRECLPGSPIPLAVAVHAAQREDALHLDDILFRRTGLATENRIPKEHTARLCQKIAPHIEWATARQAHECVRVENEYRRLGL